MIAMEKDAREAKGADLVALRTQATELRIDSMFPDPTVRILTYCEFGKISTIAAGTLNDMGFQGAIALDGGIQSWKDAGHPLKTAGS